MPPDTIINFHGVGRPGRPLESGEAPFWIGEDVFAAIAEAIARHPRRARVALTFDDGNASDWQIAAPCLRRLGLSATVFVLAGRLDTPGSLGATDLRALLAEGFAIGSHGHDHVDWRRLDDEGQRREFVEARRMIEAACGRPVTAAAVPFGLYDRRVLARLAATGHTAVYTSDGGRAGSGPVFARTSVREDMGPEGVLSVIDGRESPLRSLRRRAGVLARRWLPA